MKFATFLGRVNYEIRDFFGLERGYISHMGKKFNYLTPYMADIFYTPPIKKIGLVNQYFENHRHGVSYILMKRKNPYTIYFLFFHILFAIFSIILTYLL